MEKKKALDKAQNNFDDAPIGKDEKAKKALEKAQKGWGEKGGLLPNTKQQKVEGSTKEVSVEHRMLTEALVEHLNRIGVEASADIDEGQRMKLHRNLKSLTQRGTIYEFLVEEHSSCI